MTTKAHSIHDVLGLGQENARGDWVYEVRGEDAVERRGVERDERLTVGGRGARRGSGAPRCVRRGHKQDKEGATESWGSHAEHLQKVRAPV